ncbi:zinc finger protein ZFP2-like isoform X1 [Pectinophora gossypiella]|uniref:zinc finger protein ZFP2-like isoform X1 n=1 Tax=Pectinophora gossypiella TaxID=13191 RepID=UPI00214F4F0D|nr:zinc finger protein ZFP2-like isoform X1 [Pectinophora gossypiella]
MSEIWNLGALCRCCHADGTFKDLELPYMFQNKVEVYATILLETFGISVTPPPFEASYTICDDCIERLRDAKLFKDQVLDCDQKFLEYCQNEQQANMASCIKVEMDDYSLINEPVDDKSTIHITYEGPAIKNDNYDDDFHDHDTTENIKEKEEEEEKPKKTKEEEVTDNTPKIKPALKKRLPAKRKLKTEDSTSAKTTKTNKPNSSKKQKTAYLEVQLKTEKGVTYSCKLCGGTYSSTEDLKQHAKESHLNLRIKCDHCTKTFGNKYSLKKHLKLSATIDKHKWKCNYCDMRFTSKPSLSCHENTQHTKKERFICDLCKKDFYNKSSLRRHLRWHSGTSKAFVCDICGLQVGDSANLRIHVMTVHEKIRRFRCNVCEKAYSTNKSLKVHVASHTGEYPLVCDKCPKKFLYENTLRRHKMMHENNASHKRIYKCMVCPATFHIRGRFKAHVMKHSGFLPYKCHLCPKDFSCKYSLNRHIIQHSGIKRFHCEVCQAGFVQKAALGRHVKRVHDPTKGLRVKVKCDLCKQNVHDLEKHKQRHFERPHMCQQCKRSYPSTSSLNRHIRNEHLGHRAHPCDQCTKAYTRPDALRRHKEKKHKLIPKTEQNYDESLNVFTIENKQINVTSEPSCSPAHTSNKSQIKSNILY